jgi:putative transposase
MAHTSYPSDLSDAQWAAIGDLLSAPRQGGRPPTYELRDIVDAALYVQRTGCPWRLLPHDFPPWRTVYYHLNRWKHGGTWQHAMVVLRKQRRLKREHAAESTSPNAC